MSTPAYFQGKVMAETECARSELHGINGKDGQCFHPENE